MKCKTCGHGKIVHSSISKKCYISGLRPACHCKQFTSSEEVFKSHPEPKEKDKRLDMKEIDKLTGDLNG